MKTMHERLLIKDTDLATEYSWRLAFLNILSIDLNCRTLDDKTCITRGDSTVSLASTTGNEATRQMLQRILKHPPPYPSVVLPAMDNNNKDDPSTGYWIESDRTLFASRPSVSPEEEAAMFREHFLGREHFNFTGSDDSGQPIVLSVRVGGDVNNNHANGHHGDASDTSSHSDMSSSNDPSEHNVRVILRCADKTVHHVLHAESSINDLLSMRPSSILEVVAPTLRVNCSMVPAIFPGSSSLIAAFDEHQVSNKFKFGLVYQKFGQVSEESLFGNQSHSPAMEEFLHMLGRQVRLAEHAGYRGGLDTRHGQTGVFSLYESFHGNEIMFHVSTLLPYVEGDVQQLQRKCHIGNDIVAIIFQDANTPFSPDMIASHFLHAYIVVQPIDPCTSQTRYRVTVTAKGDVPAFQPHLPSTGIFRKGQAFKEFLLEKLINAEKACYQATKFQALRQRTRSTLLASLAQDLRDKTVEYLTPTALTDWSLMATLSSAGKGVPTTAVHSNTNTNSKLFTSVKKALKNVGKTSTTEPQSAVMKHQPYTTGTMDNNHHHQKSNSSPRCQEQDAKADSGHGDSDNSLPSSPHMTMTLGGADSSGSSSRATTITNSKSVRRKKMLSTSQPHLVDADDIIFVDSSSPVKHSGRKRVRAHNQNRTSVGNMANLQLPPGTQQHQQQPIMDPNCHTVISGSVTTIPVGGGMSLLPTLSHNNNNNNVNNNNNNMVTHHHQMVTHNNVGSGFGPEAISSSTSSLSSHPSSSPSSSPSKLIYPPQKNSRTVTLTNSLISEREKNCWEN